MTEAKISDIPVSPALYGYTCGTSLFRSPGFLPSPLLLPSHHGEDNIDFLTSLVTMSLLLFLLLQHRRYPNK